MKLLFGIIFFVQVYAQTLALSALPKCIEQELVITGDDVLELYVDGLQVKNLTNHKKWDKADKVKVPALAQVVAVKTTNKKGKGGILGSAGNFVTDASWKCTNESHNGWMNVSFDDSKWPAATAHGKNGAAAWTKFSDISTSAYWIWTRNNGLGPNPDKVVYCRTRVPACDRCAIIGTGPKCISSCTGLPDGDYQSCKGCDVYATCTNDNMCDQRPCLSPLVWDDEKKRCQHDSKTCTCVN